MTDKTDLTEAAPYRIEITEASGDIYTFGNQTVTTTERVMGWWLNPAVRSNTLDVITPDGMASWPWGTIRGIGVSRMDMLPPHEMEPRLLVHKEAIR